MTIYTTPEQFEDPTPSPFQRISTRFTQGLSKGLEQLAEKRLEKLKGQEKLSQIQALLGTPQSQQDPEQPREDILSQLSDEDVVKLSLIDPNLAKIIQSQKDIRKRVTESKAKREFERAKPVLLRADERAEGITQKESSLQLMANAVEEGNLGFFSPDNLAELTGIEGLRTGEGAQFISAGKEYFLGSLKRAGARPNQWIEQQIQKMLPKIGRTEEANLTVLEALKSELNIEKEQLNIIDQIAQQDEEKFGYIKGNIGQRTRQKLKKFADEEQRSLEIKLRAIQSREELTSSEVIMIDPMGQRRAVDKKEVKEAKKAGYKLLS